jgi:hypothetical protein
MPYNTSIVANSDLISSCHGTFNTKTSSVTTQTEIIIYSSDRQIHPLQNQMRLIACRLSGEITKMKEFREMQPISYLHLGEEVRRSNMQHTSVNGFCFVTKGRLIQYTQL